MESSQAIESRSRLTFLDPLRILASFAVVWHHARQGYLFGVGFGLFLFLVIMFGLAASGTRRETTGEFARRKAAYILIPWARWSAIYVAVLVAADLARGADPANRFELGMVFYGGHPSLWFLPFAALALGPVRALSRAASRIRVDTAVPLAALAGAIATSLAAWGAGLDIPDLPWRSWLRVSPAIFWGIALGQCLRANVEERRKLLVLVGLLGVASYVLSPFDGPPEDLPRRFGVAIPLACLGFSWRPVVPASLRFLATLTFGVYLVHPLVAKALIACFDVASWTTMEHVLAIWFGAAVVVLALRRLAVTWQECAEPRVLEPARVSQRLPEPRDS